MNDLDLRTALHRDADLVGLPSPDLLDQLVRRRRHQQRQRAGVLAAVLGVVVIAAGVPVGQSLLARSDAGPAGETTVAPTPSVTRTPSLTPDVVPTPTAASTTAEAPASSVPPPADVTSASAAPVLGPDGLGSLRLGMTRDQAEATGLVEPFRNEPSSTQCLWSSALTGAPAGEGTVLHSETLGVATIDAYPGVQTPEGITFGSSLAAVESAYPGFVLHDPGFDQNSRTGRGYAPVPGNSEAVYRIAFTDATVVELTLQYGKQDCYE
jgi:hypothetical protein